ncbi:MAG: CsbD-like [Verrucomicrobiota bacterium]|nr:CsbD-like [Verrucomicrobiota bacterium]
MNGKTDIAKGRAEEAAGALADNDKLRGKGKTDQAVGQTKETARKAVDKIAKRMRRLIGRGSCLILTEDVNQKQALQPPETERKKKC